MQVIQGVLIVLLSMWMVLDQQGIVITTWFPIMVAFFAGLIMGDMKTAMIIGGTFQLMNLGVANIGGSSVPNWGLATVVGIYVACRTTNDVAQAKAVALAVGVPVGMLGIQLDVFAKLLNTYVTHAAQKACNEKKFSKMNRILWIGPMIFALSTGLPTALCVLFGDAIVNVILKSVPVWFTNGLSIAGNMLPVVGIALLLQVMPAKKYLSILEKVLRKIHKNNDDDYVASLNNHFKYFNTTTWMANILLGASVAMEEKDGVKALDTVQNFKTGMMGPLAGIGDTLIWVLYPTIMGSIAAYMGLEGNPTGALIWMLLNVIFFFFRIKLFHLGYDSGLKLITTLGDKLSVFTEAASIMGLTVIGALIPSVVKMSLGLVFKSGKVKLAIQTGVLDKIMPALLPVALTFIVYKLLASKKLTVIQVIFLIIILALVCSFFGILAL